MNIDNANIIDIEDEQGRRYHLHKKPIGIGGQGKVCISDDGKYVVKFLNSNSPQARSKLTTKLRRVKRLPIEDLPIAKPLSMLPRPHVGYVMEFFADMISLKKMMIPPKGTDVLEHYVATGGLVRRLEILGRFARVFSQMHARSIAFGDLSPNNLFVSENADYREIRLIDVDNLFITSQSGEAVYTPGYGAPELVKKTGLPSTLSDAYSFTILAFELLTLNHPLKGDAVINGEPEIEEGALKGELPWIGHPELDVNRCSTGIPTEYVISPKMLKAFDTTLNRGLNAAEQRITMNKWVELLDLAADNTLLCTSCGSTYYRNQDICPWCDEESLSGFMVGYIFHYDPSLKEKFRELQRANDGDLSNNFLRTLNIIGTVSFQENTSRSIERRTAFLDTSVRSYDEVATIEVKSERITIRPIEETSLWVSRIDLEEYKCVEARGIRMHPGNILHFQDATKPHVMIYFRGGRAAMK